MPAPMRSVILVAYSTHQVKILTPCPGLCSVLSCAPGPIPDSLVPDHNQPTASLRTASLAPFTCGVGMALGSGSQSGHLVATLRPSLIAPG